MDDDDAPGLGTWMLRAGLFLAVLPVGVVGLRLILWAVEPMPPAQTRRLGPSPEPAVVQWSEALASWAAHEAQACGRPPPTLVCSDGVCAVQHVGPGTESATDQLLRYPRFFIEDTLLAVGAPVALSTCRRRRRSVPPGTAATRSAHRPDAWCTLVFHETSASVDDMGADGALSGQLCAPRPGRAGGTNR